MVLDAAIADTSDEDDIEDFSDGEAEAVPETQPLHGDAVPATRVEPEGGGVSSSTPAHYLSLNLAAMYSSNAKDGPSSYPLSGEMELEIGLKFPNRETAMLAVKNYNIRRSAEYKVVESDQSRYVCRCKQFGDQCRWMVRVAKTRSSRFWKFRKYEGPHSCLASLMSQDHAQLDSNVICQHIFPMVHADATICVKGQLLTSKRGRTMSETHSTVIVSCFTRFSGRSLHVLKLSGTVYHWCQWTEHTCMVSTQAPFSWA
ncbi:hypothetical protein Ahy_A03g010996 isoform F [Arachis hypogaea]|uniref:Transposase MuDR plant domain-containing protein n=1 Tax=Arachis hypogaea TaxID=3818 RepID=A0A445DP85_ARAHY|nr:hypothetical protein Ahy_A03g010996 isoform F [Arachis hypogaea]